MSIDHNLGCNTAGRRGSSWREEGPTYDARNYQSEPTAGASQRTSKAQRQPEPAERDREGSQSPIIERRFGARATTVSGRKRSSGRAGMKTSE